MSAGHGEESSWAARLLSQGVVLAAPIIKYLTLQVPRHRPAFSASRVPNAQMSWAI